MSDAEAVLRVEDLRVAFDTRDGLLQAVDGVSFAVARGRTLGIVGESGSGKTVAATTAMGLVRGARVRTSGRVLLDGEDLLGASPERLRALRGATIAMVFQDPLSALHPLLRVGAQIEEAVRAHRDVGRAAARARTLELLEHVAIPDARRRRDAYPHELSGGMRQRAMIAMALANEPRVLIADEPTTALDVTVQAQILALLRRLRDELGMAMVLITHDLGVVAETADEVAVMYAGRIVEQAPAAELFAAPQHPYTWGLLRSTPRLEAAVGADLVAIPGRPPSLLQPPSGCRFHPRCPYVRERHREVDPALEPLAAGPDHRVACLLPEAERQALWARLAAGATPEQARAAAAGGSEEAAR
ncbi:MAG TPA: ABC transporter ATP-binding protein [Conexibacter sp.]|nr:ABC transporter ATP-binding protein [Conexibacter sp.]